MLDLNEQSEFLNLKHEIEERKKSRADSLKEFARRAWPLVEPKRRFVPGFHIDAICDHLEAVARGQIQNLLINVPPRHMKSLLVSVFFCPWVWIKWPERRFLYSSYAQSLSMRDSVKARRVIESHWYRQQYRIEWDLASDQNAKNRYENTREGYRIATSVGGSGTGEGGDAIICDDPHKATEASSETKRGRVLEWWDQEMSTRANDPNNYSKIIIMQRLHENDLSGHAVNTNEYEHLRLPAEYDGRKTVTSIGWEDPRREMGELLWPERYTKERLTSLKKELGSMGTAGQLQQDPAPAEGEIVKSGWWRFWKTVPEGLTRWTQSWDLSFDATDNSSYVVGQVWACLNADRYLVHQFRERVRFTEQLRAVENTCRAYPQCGRKLVEKKANGAALIDTLGRKIQGIVAVDPRGSKSARAESVAPQIESGNVYLPHPDVCPWVNDYLHEWKMFPNGANDDQVDATSQALKELHAALNFDFGPVVSISESKWLR